MSAQQSGKLQGDEPPMYLQRPSSARSQDVTHILARTFRQLFTRDAVGPDTVHYLNKSRGGDDEYHERYVEALRQVQDERDRRMAEAAMLERHIMQAQARAMSADERELNRVSSGYQKFPDLGLPPARSHFRSCIDTQLLRGHNLITPEDFSTETIPIVPAPQASPVPNYARNTASNHHRNDDREMKDQSPLPNIGDNVSEHLISSSDLSSISPDPPENKEKLLISTNDLWKKQISAETREDVRKDVAHMQSRVDYLKNPRHAPPSAPGGSRSLIKGHKKAAKEFGARPPPEPEKKEPSVIFAASPPVLTFTEYTVGQVYEITLELKNVTTVLRPVRAIPPKSSYFSIGLGQFPGDQGLVAPGMSCHYTIKFAPDSLGDFDDCITIQTQSSTPLVIPIQGRRPSPMLTLPEELNVGECLVGGCKVTRLTVRNDGGPGRFCMMNRASWPASNFKSIVAAGCVSLSSFEIRPAVFELNTGQVTAIEILFSPTGVVSYSETMTMVCDNCQVKHFSVTGIGQVAEIELASVEGGLADALPGEACDVSAQHLIRFDSLNPYTYTQKEIEVVNKTNVEMPFNWVAVKPLLAAPQQPDEEPQDHSTQERIQDVETPFVIEPSSGMLAAGRATKFMVTFAPPEVKDFNSVLHMILRDIPRPPVNVPFPEEGEEAQLGDVVELVLPPSDNGSIQDMTALQIELKGECEEFKVILQPYAVYVPGQILVETPIKRMFRMINGSISPVTFEWEKLSADYILEVEPPFGELGPEQELDFELTVCGSKPGKINHTLVCHVHHLTEPLTLHVEAEIKGPEVVIDNPDLNFGLVRFGNTVEAPIVIRNTSQVSAKWSIKESEQHFNGAEEDSEFEFIPMEGELRPLEVTDILVRFKPRQCRSLRTLFQINVADGNEMFQCFPDALAVRAEIQSPVACLLACEVSLSDVYLDVPFIHTIKLLNQTLLSTKYEWGELEGADSDFCTISVEPHSGDLGPREELALSLHFTAYQSSDMTDLKLPCWVEGMSEPLILSITCDVKGLNVTYRSQSGDSEPSEDLMLDFGSDVPLGECRKCYLCIKNNSAISAPYSIHIDHFYAKPPTPPDGRPDAYMPSKSQRRALLGKTPNLANPSSRTPAKAHADQLQAKKWDELCKTMLRQGRGAAFTVHPAAGMLQPFSEERIELMSFCDMWGEYNDKLVCKVENLDPVHVPIKMEVVGSPLNFQIVAPKSGVKPVLRFGTHVSGVAAVTRQMRINNTAPVDIRLDWQVFNVDKSDNQPLDMVVNFGDFFPLLDEQGNEIQPLNELTPSPAKREPTGFIPNTPDTSPAASRENSKASDGVESSPSTARSVEYRPKVISVVLREHGGTESSDPFSIKPSQTVVPARASTCLNVSFNPFPTSDVNHTVDCAGYALGYASLEGSAQNIEGTLYRKQHFEVEPLRLDMTAQVKPALLTIECRDEDTMNYRAAASDLMIDGQIEPESLKMCAAVLSNQTETPLVFRLLSSEPFQIVYTDPETQAPILQLLQTEMASLNPRQNMLVQVGFRISLELLESISSWNSEAEDEEQKRWELEMHGQERRIQFSDELIVEFNNKTIQKLPLTATLILPSLVISKENIDFGTCLVGQTREMQFTLENPSASASHWSVMLESRAETCTDETFRIEPNEGSLEPFITHVSTSKTLIKVFFTAKHTEDYEAVFIVQGLLGEEPRRLQLTGSGSYDGKHEALVNV